LWFVYFFFCKRNQTNGLTFVAYLFLLSQVCRQC
jgi:hypothetical protein